MDGKRRDTHTGRAADGGRSRSDPDRFFRKAESIGCGSNPFDRLDFLAAGVREPRIDVFGEMDYLAGIGLRHLAEDIGVHRVRALLNGQGHAARIFEKLRDFLPAEGGITAERVYAIYQESTARQLAA